MKVAVVHNYHSAGTPSGEDIIVDAEIELLRSRGHVVGVFGVANAVDRWSGAGSVIADLMTNISAKDVRRSVDRFSADVVHVHNLYPRLGRTWAAGLSAPIVQTLHNYRSHCPIGTLYKGGDLCTKCPDGDRLAPVRQKCVRNSRLLSVGFALPYWMGSTGYPWTLPNAAAYVAVSQTQARVLTTLGFPSHALHVVENFLPPASHAEVRMVPQSGRTNRWVAVGRLSEEKGLRELVSLWPDGEPLDIIGDGPMRAELEGLDHPMVTLRGMVSHDAAVRAISTSRGLVFPSRWYETFGLSYLEALASGTAVVAFPPGAVADMVQRDRAGFVAGWSQRQLRESLTLAAGAYSKADVLHRRRTFEERYSPDAHYRELVSVFEEAVRTWKAEP